MEKSEGTSRTPSDAENRRRSSSGQSPERIPEDDATRASRGGKYWSEHTPRRVSCSTRSSNASWDEEVVQEELRCSGPIAPKSDRAEASGRDERRSSRTFSNSNYRARDATGAAGRRSEPYRGGGDKNEGRKMEKRTSYDERGGGWRGARDSSNSFGKSRKDPSEDAEFQQYQDEIRSWKKDIPFIRTRELTSDLFEADDDYSLAHCVAEDMNMGSGIAVLFRHKFKRVGDLLNQHQRSGGLAVLDDKQRYIYYLVTKRFSSGKPTYTTLFSSLKCLRDHVQEHKIDKIAMPRIGCGLDRLEWSDVRIMIEFVFRDVDIDIVVCNLEPTEELTSPQQRHKNCKVTHEKYPIQDIDSNTIILYFSSEDGSISEEMQKLDEKFHFLLEFKHARKTQGSVVFYTKNVKYLICGCVVRKSKGDRFDFVALQKCLSQIQKENKKYQFYYYAFQALRDRTDFCVNYKIINILRNSLREVEVYVCWPGDLQNEMAPRDRFEDAARESFSRGDDKRDSGGFDADKKGRTWGKSDNWRQNNNDYDKGTKETTPVKGQDGRNAHNDSFDTWSSSSPQDNSNLAAPDLNESLPTSTTTDENSPESDSHWHNDSQAVPLTPSSGAVEKPQTKSPDVHTDGAYESFRVDFEAGKIDVSKLREQEPARLPKQYSRVCFAREDLIVDGGIPPGEDIKFIIGKLLKKEEKEGGLVWFKEETGFLYCLVIGRAHSPPKSYSVFSAFKNLLDHAFQNHVGKVVIPVVASLGGGCLKWHEIKAMFAYLLAKTPIDVTLIKTNDWRNYDQPSLLRQNRLKLVHKRAAIHQMAKKSVVLYLASADGRFTDEMNGLARKFDFGEGFEKAKKLPGEVVRHKENEDHVVYGCVVKRSADEAIDFEEFRKCLLEVKRSNSSGEKLPVVGIQAAKDADEGTSYKLVTVLLHCLEDVTVQVCWPGDLKSLMPKS